MELERNNPNSKKQRTLSEANTVLERGRRIKMAAEIGLAASSKGRHWSRALHRRHLRKNGREYYTRKSGCIGHGFSEAKEVKEGGDEVVEIEKRVKVLQSLVPGGEAMEMESLFEETADYIEALEEQVSAMRALATFLDALDQKEKWMMGG